LTGRFQTRRNESNVPGTKEKVPKKEIGGRADRHAGAADQGDAGTEHEYRGRLQNSCDSRVKIEIFCSLKVVQLARLAAIDLFLAQMDTTARPVRGTTEQRAQDVGRQH